MLSKRDLLQASIAGLAATGLPIVNAEERGQDRAAAQGMSNVPPDWYGKEQMAFLIYPEFTALDMVGAYQMLTGLMGSTAHLIAKTKDPIVSDNGLTFVPSKTFDDCPKDLDILCVPGGASGTLAVMQDDSTLRFLKDRGSRARFVTSVCTGSLVLGAAGLLTGYKATSHWATVPLLPLFGANATKGRVVRDRNRVTAGGVTAGIDFGLSLVGQLRDRQYAECLQLMVEYAPEPPFDARNAGQGPTRSHKNDE